MIGSFWNLCRACPSMPVDKLHSEYRSTYKWHEYRAGGVAQALGIPVPAGGQAPAPAPAPAVSEIAPAVQPVTQPPPARRAAMQSNVLAAGNIEPAMPRRKKYPGLAYKSNEIFDSNQAAAGLPSGQNQYVFRDNIIGNAFTLDRARSMERTKYAASRGERRSKSEGPRRTAQNNPPRNWIDTVDEKVTSLEKRGVSSEYRKQFAWPREDTEKAAGATTHTDETDGGAPKKSVSMGALKAAARRKNTQAMTTELEPLMNHTDDDDDRKKYIEDYVKEGDPITSAPRKTAFRNAIESFRRGGDQNKPSKTLKSEYKKKFRPFSYYVYEASKGTFTKCRGKAKQADGAPQEAEQAPKAPEEVPLRDPADKGDTWYKEVLDLRKRAGEYKCRGWGTETAPEHLTELYKEQIDVWYQVSRRTSLSALALATSRAISKEEKDKENESKNRTSPKKPRSFKSMHVKLPENKQTETANQKNQRKKLQGHSFDNVTVEGGRGASVEPAAPGEQKQEYRSPKRRPRSADPKPMANGPTDEKRRPSKPSGLPLNTTNRYSSADHSSPNTSKSLHGSPKRKAIRAKVGITIDDDAIPLRTGSAFRDHRLLDDSPVVKSPPEPTRVKSPEQMNMRSPDPVNWTVPLDTGKTFTVTQNVKDDLIKRPGSDFKSYAGDDPHSASFSAPLDGFDTKTNSHQDTPSVHKSEVTPPKSVEFSQKPYMSKLAKTPTSPPNLTPIDETKVLDMNSIAAVNGDACPKPSIRLDDPTFDMKSTEATQKGHGGVDTNIVSTGANQSSVAAEVLEKARTRFDQFWGKKDDSV